MLGDCTKMMLYVYSFQAYMKLSMAMAAMPGATGGSTILRNSCHSVAPSIWADSSISTGRSWKKLIMNQMIRGILMRIQARVGGILVFRMPSLENMVYSGMVKATGGSTRTSRIQ